MKWNIYINALITGFVVVSFEMLGSRFLNPYFGSGIYTWGAIISTVLFALMVGYFGGGKLADKKPSYFLLGSMIIFSSVYLCIIPHISDVALRYCFDNTTNLSTATLISSFILFFFPLALLGAYSPFAIRLVLKNTSESGSISGFIYGLSTFGSIIGALVTTFYLIPNFGTVMIT